MCCTDVCGGREGLWSGGRAKEGFSTPRGVVHGRSSLDSVSLGVLRLNVRSCVLVAFHGEVPGNGFHTLRLARVWFRIYILVEAELEEIHMRCCMLEQESSETCESSAGLTPTVPPQC